MTILIINESPSWGNALHELSCLTKKKNYVTTTDLHTCDGDHVTYL